MRTVGLVAAQIVLFVGGFFGGFYVVGMTLIVSDGMTVVMAPELVAIFAGCIYVVVRMNRLEAAGNRAVAVPVGSAALGVAVGVAFYGVVFIAILRMFGMG